MRFSYNWLQSFFKKKLPKPEKLAEFLMMRFAEVEKIKKEGKDFILDIDIRPNRAPDCFSHLGVAREIAAIIEQKYTGLTCVIREVRDKKIKDFIFVEVKNKIACPRYTASVITDVKVGPSPKWIQERLKLCGLKPINNIVDIANYVMLETGQPLHAFDGRKLEGEKIIVRFAEKNEKIMTLDGKKYDLDKDILVIADAEKPIAIAGIKGGKIPEIDDKTKIVVLESANFSPRVIRKSSRKLNLRTDASIRFEHGIDPNLTEIAINRAAYLIQEIACPHSLERSDDRRAKGKIVKGLIDVYPKKVLPKTIKLDLNYVERLLGVKISEKEIKNILQRLEFKILNSKFKILNIEIPTRRLDILIPEDLIEEIGRIYGYEKIPAQFPVAALVPPKRNLNIFWEEIIKNTLKEVEFTEVYNYSFFGEKEVKTFSCRKEELIEIENPINQEQKYLRASLIPNLLKNAERNLRHAKEIKIFELGKIFKKPATEKRMLTGVIVGDAFYQVKGVVDLLFNRLGIGNILYDNYQPTPEESKIMIWHSKKCAEIKINHQKVGFLGEISPQILEDLKINQEVVVFDIDFEELQKLSSEEIIYQPLSRYPAAVRDLAILVPLEIKIAEVLNKIKAAGEMLIQDVDLFDIYEGKELPQGKKNLAFHIIYQSKTKTLSSKEIDELQQKIIKALEKEPEWQVRK